MDKICILAAEFRGDYNDDFVIGAEKEANRLGYGTDVYTMLQLSDLFTNNEETIYNMIDYSRYKGVIYVERSFARHKSVQKNMGIEITNHCPLPSVTIGSTRDSDIEGAIFDDCSSMFESLTDHLIEVHDCKELYFLGGEPNARNGKRIDGFIRALKKHDLDCGSERILYGGYWVDCAEKLGKNIAYGNLEKPDAVVCINDAVAYALVKSLYKYGLRVPEDILVTGFDGDANSKNKIIPITTIAADAEYVGRRAMSVLYTKITSQEGPEIKHKLRTINTGLSCGCGFKKPADVRLKLDQEEKNDIKRMEFRNSTFEEKMLMLREKAELSNILKNHVYLIPDYTSVGVNLCNEGDEQAECVYLTGAVENDKGVWFEASKIYPDKMEPVGVKNTHIFSMVFSEKQLGFITIGYDEANVYGEHAKHFAKIVINGLAVFNRTHLDEPVMERPKQKSLTDTKSEPADNKEIILANKDGYVCKIAISNILYAEAEGRKVYVVTKNDSYNVKMRLFEVEEILAEKGFMRISKSTIANLAKIVSYKTDVDRTIIAVMVNQDKIRVSRSMAEEFKERMTEQ